MKYLLALLCLLAIPARAQTPAAPEPTICIPAEQARILDAAAQRYEKLKPIYVDAVRANQHYEQTHLLDSAALGEKAKTISYYQQRRGNDQVLLKDATYKAAFWQKKARRRGWREFLLAVLLGGTTYLLFKP